MEYPEVVGSQVRISRHILRLQIVAEAFEIVVQDLNIYFEFLINNLWIEVLRRLCLKLTCFVDENFLCFFPFICFWTSCQTYAPIVFRSKIFDDLFSLYCESSGRNSSKKKLLTIILTMRQIFGLWSHEIFGRYLRAISAIEIYRKIKKALKLLVMTFIVWKSC